MGVYLEVDFIGYVGREYIRDSHVPFRFHRVTIVKRVCVLYLPFREHVHVPIDISAMPCYFRPHFHDEVLRAGGVSYFMRAYVYRAGAVVSQRRFLYDSVHVIASQAVPPIVHQTISRRGWPLYFLFNVSSGGCHEIYHYVAIAFATRSRSKVDRVGHSIRVMSSDFGRRCPACTVSVEHVDPCFVSDDLCVYHVVHQDVQRKAGNLYPIE